MENPAQNIREVGIDLGTTNSVVTYYDGGSIKTLKFGTESIIPSALFFQEPGKVIFGKEAVGKLRLYPESGTRYFKRKLGDLKNRYDIIKYQKISRNAEGVKRDQIYVIDTNVFIEIPEVIKQFYKEELIFVPITVSEELNYHIKMNPATKFQAEKAISMLDRYPEQIRYETSDESLLPEDLFKSTTTPNDRNDNKILSIALKLKEQQPILITNDRKLRQKAKSVGVITENFDEFRLKKTIDKASEQSSFTISAEESTQLFLKHLREAATIELRKETEDHLLSISKAAIGIPASFTPQQEDATRKAAYAAGFDEVRLIREPFAAAIAYGYDASRDKKLLVYDWGGGTFDVSIIEIGVGGKFRNLGVDGDGNLGGEDITATIVERIIDELEFEREIMLEELAINEEERHKNKATLYKVAEEVKIQLSEFESAPFTLPLFTSPGQKEFFEMVVERKTFENWIAKFVQRTLQKTSDALKRAELQYSDIDITVLAGGTSLIPYVRHQVEAAFGFKPNYEKNTALVIAEGAAIYAATEFGSKKDLTDKPQIFDKTMHHFGVLKNKIDFQMVIPAGTELPAKESVNLMPLHDNAEILEINVFRGDVSSQCQLTTEPEMAQIEKLTITNIPPRLRTDVDVEITFEMTMHYGLEVTAQVKDRTTGEVLSHGHIVKDSTK